MKKALPTSVSPTSQQGFTLIELVMTIAILAILVSIATPSFTSAIRNNQISSQTNDLVTTLALARSEATKQHLPVKICTSAAATCSGSTDWSQGWLTFVDKDGNGAVDTGELLQKSSTPPTGMTINAQDSLTNPLSDITYQRDGRSSIQATFIIRKTGCGAYEQRQLSIDLMGHSHLTKQNCPP